MRGWLELRRCDFVEYDVEADAAARQRMQELSGGQRNVPLLAEGGKVLQVGWMGRSCIVDGE
jgi:glutaredoxin 3